MTDQQKRAAATISLSIVIVSAVLLILLAIQTGALVGPLGDHFSGREFILLVHTRGSLEILLEALPAIISLGLSIVAGARLKDWQFYATVAVTVLGIVMCVYMVMELSDPVQAQRFWAYSPVDAINNYATFNAAARPFLVAVGGWFVAVLTVQLGVTAPQEPPAPPAPPLSPPAPDVPAAPPADSAPGQAGDTDPAGPVDDPDNQQG